MVSVSRHLNHDYKNNNHVTFSLWFSNSSESDSHGPLFFIIITLTLIMFFYYMIRSNKNEDLFSKYFSIFCEKGLRQSRNQ